MEGAPDRRVLFADSAILAITALLAVAALALTVVARSDLVAADSVPNIASTASSLLYAGLGSLIVRRARNPIGWILHVVGFGLAAVAFTSAYAIVGIVTSPGSLPAAAVVGSLAEPAFVMTASTLGLMLFFFPDGRLPSPRWRPVAVVGAVAAVATTLGFVVNPSPVGLPAPGGLSLLHPNSFGIERRGAAISGALFVIVWVLVLSIAGAFLSLVSRYRRGTAEVRQQIKWIAFAEAVTLALQLVFLLALFACRCDVGQSPIAVVFGLAIAIVVLVRRDPRSRRRPGPPTSFAKGGNASVKAHASGSSPALGGTQHITPTRRKGRAINQRSSTSTPGRRGGPAGIDSIRLA